MALLVLEDEVNLAIAELTLTSTSTNLCSVSGKPQNICEECAFECIPPGGENYPLVPQKPVVCTTFDR